MTSSDLNLALTILPLQCLNSIYMVFVSTLLATLIGIPIGVILVITSQGHIKQHNHLHQWLSTVINIGRSFPFAILMVALIPFTRWILGTSLGTSAAIVPLTVAAIPFMARLTESSLKQIDRHILEAATVMGSTVWETIFKVLLPEALPSLILAVTTTCINLIGYSAMAGFVGGGGLGQVAIQYGYLRFNTFMMIATVILLIIFVQVIQWFGHRIAHHFLKTRGEYSHE